MAYIELWQSKPEWLQAPREERHRIMQGLEQLVRRHTDREDGQGGPFEYCNDQKCALVWQVRPERGAKLQKEYERILGAWFKQVMSGSVEGHTAQDYYNRFLKDL
ncbi:MAG: hypothetical protein WCF84_10275 [Anaerolineae bacterium]